MLEIGVNGGALVLTVLIVAACRKAGRGIASIGALIAGMALAVLYGQSGDPWQILHQQAGRIRDNLASELDMAAQAGAAALALALFLAWFYVKPGAKMSAFLGFMVMVCASSSSDLFTKITGIFDSLISIITG